MKPEEMSLKELKKKIEIVVSKNINQMIIQKIREKQHSELKKTLIARKRI